MRRVDPIVSTKVIKPNVILSGWSKDRSNTNISWGIRLDLRIITSLMNTFIYTVTTTVDCAILRAHDSFDRTLTLDIAGETWNFRDDDDNLNHSRNHVNLHRHEKKNEVTLNFWPSFAARIIRSKSALAIKLVTTSPVLVEEMLKMYVRAVVNVVLLPADLQELILYLLISSPVSHGERELTVHIPM